MCVVGVVLSGVAVSFFKSAVFGVDPFQAFMSGLDALIPIKYGTLYVLVNAVLLVFSLVFDKARIGLGTLKNLCNKYTVGSLPLPDLRRRKGNVGA